MNSTKTIGSSFLITLFAFMVLILLINNTTAIAQQGYALNFDGGDRVTIPNSNSLNPSQITLEFWIKFNQFKYGNSNAQFLMCKGKDNVAGAYVIGQGGDIYTHQLWLGFSIVRGGGSPHAEIITSASLELNRWYHIAGTYDGHNMIKLYLNGILLDSAEVGVVAVGNSEPLYLSYNDVPPWTYHLYGDMDEIRIWNYARTEVEIQSHMNTSLNGNEAGLVGYWRLDEGSGQTINDSTANNNNGYLGSSQDPDSEDPTWLPLLAYTNSIPDTGQTKCYDNTQEITCPQPGEPFYGQDGQYDSNLQSYTDLGNGIVLDNVTGLEWQQDTAPGTYTWEQAIDYCDNLVLGGHSDWRLPSVKELSFIRNLDTYNPTINTTYFPYTIPYAYWSSDVWVVHFYHGHVRRDYVNAYVRAVRGQQYGPFGNFFDNGDGTVTDTDTGLMWQQDTASGAYKWQEALQYCENLTLAGHDNWRLPNVFELQSLIDYTRSSPSINTAYFPNTVSFFYWSSTPYSYYPAYSWAASFSDGFVYDYTKSDHDYSVRAVRCGLLTDNDCDEILNEEDNCPNNYNPNQEDTEEDGIGDVCDPCPNDYDNDIDSDSICGDIDNCPNTYNPDQLDSYPPLGNGIGDACDCEGNFNCYADSDVDGSDASTFKADFGRSVLNRRCVTEDTCNGDFTCDRDVDGSDASLFKQDFGRSSLQNPCPMCAAGIPWCNY